jgi:WXG100 family type VII secretion target
MTDTPLYYNYSNIQQVIDELVHAEMQIGNDLEQLNGEIQPLRASWLGVSDTEFQAVQQKWVQHTLEMQAVLKAHHVTLGTMAENTALTDNGIAAQIAAIP